MKANKRLNISIGHRTTAMFKNIENPIDLGYIAGIIDGEGSISISKPPKINILVNTTTPELTKHLQELCGGSFSGPYLYRSGVQKKRNAVYNINLTCKPQYHWTLTCKPDIHKFLKQIYPYLIIEAKREKAKEAIKWLEETYNL